MAEKTTMTKSRTYLELITLKTLHERYEYLKLSSSVGAETFGPNRYLNQVLYTSPEWKRLRSKVIVRDEGCDLGCSEYPIHGKIYIHHINPISIEDIKHRSASLFDMNNLICVSFDTHQAIHYGDSNLLPKELITRTQNDTIPWR